MHNNKSTATQIAIILRKIGHPSGIAQANTLTARPANLDKLHLRNLGLDQISILAIAEVLQQEKDHGQGGITSISFSYNPQLGDVGAIAIANSLPHSIREIGLVDCGIGEDGGTALLARAEEWPNLRMLCVEQNSFSDQLRQAYRRFGARNPHLLLVY